MTKVKKTNCGHKATTFLLLFLLSISTVFAQNITVKGVVLDAESQDPLIGVAVFSPQLKQGTVTDIDGNYSISVPQKSQLTFSYLGYESQTVTVNSTTLNISLSSQTFEIGDIVVVGTRMRKSDLTGAVGGISEKQLREIPTTDLSTAMQGKVPGLFVSRGQASPGGDVTVKVRGTNSISYGTEPVYVVDGMIVEQGLKLVNPDDIASIEVLKDASSTALYGSRASNGVIVITTKRGRTGEGKVSYSGFVTISNYQNRLKRLNARQLYDLRVEAYVNGFLDKNPGGDVENYINETLLKPGKQGAIFSEEELYNGQNNLTSDWMDDITRTGITQNHAVNFSGGNDKTTYYIGLSYSDEKGVLKNAGYTRYSGKINLDQQIKPWLKVGTNTLLSHGQRSMLEGDAYNIAFRGNPLQTKDRERNYMYWEGVAQMGEYNPLLSLDIDREEVHDRILSSNYLEINPIKNLYLRSTFAVDIFYKQDNRYTPSYTGQSVRDNYGGIGWQWRSNDLYWQWDNSISYEKTFDEKHRVFALFSTGVSKKKYNSVSIDGYRFPIDDYGYKNMGYASNKDLNKMSSEYKTSTLLSYTARVNYSYEQKYLLTATVRRDGSSRFAKDNRWGTFPSFSGAWNITEESFMESTSSWLDQFKLRVGYGILGNQNIPEYAYLTIFNPVYSSGEVGLVVDDKRFENKDIKWEKQKQWNFGTDVTVWNNRISMTFDVFYMKNTDLLMRMNLFPSFGNDYKIANIAELENKGVEFSINAELLRTKDFSWNVAGNIAHDKNKIKKLFEGVDVIWNGGNIRNRDGNLFIGQSLNSIYSLKYNKIAQESDMDYVNGLKEIADGKVIRPGDYLPMDVDGDGKIRYEDDMVIVGKKDPKFYGGFSTSLQYKDFSFESVFTYSYGAKRFSGIYETMMGASGTSVASKDMLKRWTPENTNTSVPRAWRGSGENRFSLSELSNSVLNASYLRCAAMTLSYNVPNSLIGKYVSNIRVYATANNLFLITPYKGYDPESGEDYPMSRSFTFGLNLSF